MMHASILYTLNEPSMYNLKAPSQHNTIPYAQTQSLFAKNSTLQDSAPLCGGSRKHRYKI